MALKEKDFLDLGFTNCTLINVETPERTKIIFQIVKGNTNLIFSRLVTDELWRISDGRATVNKVYADAKIESERDLRIFLTLYKKNLLRVDDGGNYV